MNSGKENVKMLYSKGNHLIESGRFDEALACFDKAIEIDDRDAGVWNNKGVALYRMRRFEDALACFDRALRMNPRDAKVWRNKGNVLVELGMLNEAVKCFNRAIEVDVDVEVDTQIGGI